MMIISFFMLMSKSASGQGLLDSTTSGSNLFDQFADDQFREETDQEVMQKRTSA
jgi:hypothetical protein